MKKLVLAAAIASGLLGMGITAAQAHPHHRHCTSWGWHHHHARYCRHWGW
jgi:hypothetical protein